jgi:hypothetical protein
LSFSNLVSRFSLDSFSNRDLNVAVASAASPCPP